MAAGGSISAGAFLIYTGGVTIAGTWAIPGANVIGIGVGGVNIAAGVGLIGFGGFVLFQAFSGH